MKVLKSLLLASAAGVVAVAGAQAADLPVKAKPVEYVRICTLYGDGFYYIPGSDTCIRFSGYIRADYGYNVTGARTPNYLGNPGAQDRTVFNYSTRHRGSFSVDTRTQTAYGTLRTFQTHHMQNENETFSFNVARAFIQWGGFTFGRTVSFTDHEGSLGDSGFRSLHQTQNESSTGANGTNQIAYTWQLGNGMTFNIGADDRRVNPIVNLSGTDPRAGFEPDDFFAGHNHPDPWVAFRVSQAWGRASVAVVAVQNQATYFTGDGVCPQPDTTLCGFPSDKWGWAVISGTEIKLDWLSPGSRIGGYFNYGVGATRFSAGNNLGNPGLYGSGNEIAFGFVVDSVYFDGVGLQQTTAWSLGGGFEYFWTRNFSSTIYGSFTDVKYNDTVINSGLFCQGNILLVAGTVCDPGFRFWTVGTHHDWFPLPGLRFAVDVLYTRVESKMAGELVAIDAPAGARPTGIYTVKDLGILSTVFRAQRTWGAE
jgi:Porin subfamily